MSSELEKVTGSACLDYIDKYLGFASRRMSEDMTDQNFYASSTGDPTDLAIYARYYLPTQLYHVPHNKNKRVCGFVMDEYEDGGMLVAILGDEEMHITYGEPQNFGIYQQEMECNLCVTYFQDLDQTIKKDEFQYVPIFSSNPSTEANKNKVRVVCTSGQGRQHNLTADEALDFQPIYRAGSGGSVYGTRYFYVNGENYLPEHFHLTKNKNTTLQFGYGVATTVTHVPPGYVDNPLANLGGDLYSYAQGIGMRFEATCPASFDDSTQLSHFRTELSSPINSCNGVCIPFNLILTRNENSAINYVENGTLPSDAWLYPLDWDNLPKYSEYIDNTDDDDGGDPDDDGNNNRDIDDTPLVTPAVTPSMFNANNVYWVNIGQFSQFLIWFWYDIQQFSILNPTTWDNLFDNIQGLYENLANAILSVRYMPVKPEYLGGIGSDNPIKVGQVQQSTKVPTLDTSGAPPIVDIGHYEFGEKFKSYLDLAPYSEISLYLPYYGYIDLDVDMFMGHRLNVKAIYDWQSGTIQYYLYYDNKFLVNFYNAKISVDIPITLQTAYDRDRAIQSNTITALSGFMSAGASALAGNPVGLALSAGAIASPQQSSPIKVEGMGAEQGILYAPSHCAVIIRRPTTTKKGSAYASNVGYAWAKTSTLDSLSGFTVCQSPKINFSNTAPMQSEVDEIYSYLEKGVIL